MLNYVGVRESAILTAVLALASFGVNVVVLTVVSVQLDAAQWPLVLDQFKAAAALPPWPLLVGFSGSWLAYSGLESISQIAPALRPPREKTALRAMILVMGAILLTSPLATALETALLRASRGQPRPLHVRAGRGVRPAVVAARDRRARRRRCCSARRTPPDRLLPRVPGAGPPRVPAPLAVGPQPEVQHPAPRHRGLGAGAGRVVAASRAQLGILGHIYTFGLLGAFTLTSVGLDKVKWQERVRGIGFYFGVADVGARGQRLGDQPRAPPLRDGAGHGGDRARLRVRDRGQEGMAGRGPQRLRRRRGRRARRHRDGVGGRDPDRRRGDPDARDVPVDDAGRRCARRTCASSRRRSRACAAAARTPST